MISAVEQLVFASYYTKSLASQFNIFLANADPKTTASTDTILARPEGSPDATVFAPRAGSRCLVLLHVSFVSSETLSTVLLLGHSSGLPLLPGKRNMERVDLFLIARHCLII